MQVFEHQKVCYAHDSPFQKKHYDALRYYHSQYGSKYFQLLHNGVRFKQYVGVLQVGNLTIEILPKTDNSTSLPTTKWQYVLLELLQATQAIPVTTTSEAGLALKSGTLIDWYLSIFIKSVNDILRKGLIKSYRTTTTQSKSLKGKLATQNHFTKNIVHKEVFFTTHQVYDHNHLFHQILIKALSILKELPLSSQQQQQINQLAFQFPPCDPLVLTPDTFSRLHFTRKNYGYKTAIQLARLIIQSYTPVLQQGNFPIVAILFDMNMLFEKYILHQLQQTEKEQIITILSQPRIDFWQHKTLRPDILIQKNDQKILLDTKWKILHSPQPSDEDLRQMYVYQQYFDAQRSILVYPKIGDHTAYVQGYYKPVMFKNQTLPSQHCDLLFVDIFKHGKLNRGLGNDILAII